MRPLIVYSRGFFDGFLIILVENLSVSENYIYNKGARNSICKIYIEKTNDIVFDHLSTVTGFRKARIALNIPDVEKIVICASWNKEEALFGIIKNNTTIASVKAKDQFFNVKMDEHGSITLVAMNVTMFREIRDGNEIETPYALESWTNVLNEINTLLKEVAGNTNYLFCIEVYKSCVTKLATGLEVYMKNRFIELEETILPNYENLLKFVKRKEQLAFKKEMVTYYAEGHKRILKKLISNKRQFNFQDWQKCQDLYKKVYGISFREIPNIDDKKLSVIEANLVLRHRIGHTDKISGILNPENLHNEKPINMDNRFINTVKQDFDFLVRKLHEYSESKVNDAYIFERGHSNSSGNFSI